jgi:hypothetical protein
MMTYNSSGFNKSFPYNMIRANYLHQQTISVDNFVVTVRSEILSLATASGVFLTRLSAVGQRSAKTLYVSSTLTRAPKLIVHRSP